MYDIVRIWLVGNYRKGRLIDSAMGEILSGAEASGGETEKIYLKHLFFRSKHGEHEKFI